MKMNMTETNTLTLASALDRIVGDMRKSATENPTVIYVV